MHTNTDIFDFKFVDRKVEKNIVKEFIQSEDSVLWIDGIHGVGKSYFIEKYIIPTMQSLYEYTLYINKSSNESKSYLELLVNTLSSSLPIPFESYVKKNYTLWKNIAKNVSKVFTDINIFNTQNVLINSLLDLDSIFVSVKEQNQTSPKVLDSYLEDVVLNSSAFIILDNFSYCDPESFHVIEEMLISLKDTKNIKFLVCTTTEEREKNKELNVLICEKIPHTYIPIKELGDARYFREILSSKFHMSQSLFENINDIYELCNGLPDNLRNFIRQLYIKNGIHISYEGFTIVEEKAVELIYNKSINFDPNTLNKSQMLIVQILALFHRPMSFKMLEDFITSVNDDKTQNIFVFKLISDKLFSIIETLLNSKILDIKIQMGIELLSFEHDNIFNALYNYYHQERSSANVAFIHYLLFLFIDNHKLEMEDYGLSESDVLWILAEQSYYARIDNWEEYNNKLAIQLYKENKLYCCNQVLGRFRKASIDISNNIRLFMAEVFYEIAEYQACIQSLDDLNVNALLEDEKLSYYLLYGKAVSFRSSQKALDNFLLALKLNISFEQKCILQYYCEMSFSEISGCLDKAKDIFYQFYNDKRYRDCSLFASVLRSSANLFVPQKSLKYLKEGLKIAQSKKDILEEAKIENNLGFTYTRIDNYDDAEYYFLLACNNLQNTKPFEMCYPITNLAFIYMVKQEWQKALEYIEMASIYNKTEFIPIVLKTYKMICLAKLQKLDSADVLKTELTELIKTNKISDYKMIKKIKINCAYVSNQMGDVETKERLLQDCWLLVKNTFAEKRFLNLCKSMEYKPPVTSTLVWKAEYDLYEKIDFEPWIVTFGHD